MSGRWLLFKFWSGISLLKICADLLWHSLTLSYFLVLSMISLNNLTAFSLFPFLITPSICISYIFLYLICFVYFYLYFYFLYTQYNWDWWGTFVITGLAGKEAPKLKRSHQIQLLSNQQTMIFSCQSVPPISLQGVSKRSSDCCQAQLQQQLQLKFRLVLMSFIRPPTTHPLTTHLE